VYPSQAPCQLHDPAMGIFVQWILFGELAHERQCFIESTFVL
jgi:hypothetical protein